MTGAVLLAACGGPVAWKVRKGDFEGAVAKAEASRRPLRGRVARAYATALVELGRTDQARSVLMLDYRHGGEVDSLVALADLEHGLGLDGLAASHYGRLADLSPEAIEGRDDVCQLLRRRSAVWAAEGAGLAAARDLVRAAALCGSPADEGEAARLRALGQEVQRSGHAQLDQRVALGRCDEGCDPVEAEGEAIDAALAEAREQGPAALRRVADRLRVEVPADDVVAVLTADLRGEAGESLVSDDEVRQLVGSKGWSALAPSVMSRPPDVASYLQLRLASVVSDVPVALRSRTGPGELDVWLAQSLEATGEHAWRMLAWAGDVTAAELALGTSLRPPRRAAGTGGASGEAAGEAAGGGGFGAPAETGSSGAKAGARRSGASAVTSGEGATEADGAGEPSPGAGAAAAGEAPREVAGVPPVEHWSSRVEPTADNLFTLLVEGRMRFTAGQERVGLGIQRYVAARAHAAGLPEADARVAREAGWHLAHGRPWHALAVASVVPSPHAQRAAAAAATALRLGEAFCGGSCQDDRDRMGVERVMGEAWVEQQQPQWVALSRRRARPRAALDACPTLGELLAPDARGRLAEALAAAQSSAEPPGQGERLRAAIEADLGLGCAGRFVVPLLREGHHDASAGALADLLSHDAALEAPRALTVHATLAMVGGHEDQASLLATAAGAASSEPVRTWWELAGHAHATGHRELALRSLREALMHAPHLDAPAIHRALLVVGLAGIDTEWNLREAPAGRAEPATHVRDLLERVPPARRFAAREDLARVLAEQPWFDADARQRLSSALWPDPQVERAHEIGRAWVGLRSGRPPDLEPADVGPLDLASQELLVAMGKQTALPPATVVFADPVDMEPLRLALARSGRDWVQRWHAAIGLACWGTPVHRAQAMAVLLEMAEPEQRAALVDLVLEAPAVIEPGSGGPQEAALLSSPEHELAVVFSLPLDPLLGR